MDPTAHKLFLWAFRIIWEIISNLWSLIDLEDNMTIRISLHISTSLLYQIHRKRFLHLLYHQNVALQQISLMGQSMTSNQISAS